MARSSLWPLVVATVSAIEGSSELAVLLAGDKVFNTIVPIETPLPYCTVTTPAESEQNMFGNAGSVGSLQIDIWTRNALELGNSEQLAIWDALYFLLHNRRLTVTGFRMLTGTLTLIAIQPDADGETLHGIVRYDVTMLEGS